MSRPPRTFSLCSQCPHSPCSHSTQSMLTQPVLTQSMLPLPSARAHTAPTARSHTARAHTIHAHTAHSARAPTVGPAASLSSGTLGRCTAGGRSSRASSTLSGGTRGPRGSRAEQATPHPPTGRAPTPRTRPAPRNIALAPLPLAPRGTSRLPLAERSIAPSRPTARCALSLARSGVGGGVCSRGRGRPGATPPGPSAGPSPPGWLELVGPGERASGARGGYSGYGPACEGCSDGRTDARTPSGDGLSPPRKAGGGRAGSGP